MSRWGRHTHAKGASLLLTSCLATGTWKFMSCHTQGFRTDWPRAPGQRTGSSATWLSEQPDNGHDCWLSDVCICICIDSVASELRVAPIYFYYEPFESSACCSLLRQDEDTCLQLGAWPLIIGRPLLIIAQLLPSVIQLGYQTMMLNRLARVECQSSGVESIPRVASQMQKLSITLAHLLPATCPAPCHTSQILEHEFALSSLGNNF